MCVMIGNCCRIIGVNTQAFHRCRAVSPVGQYFTMNECSVGQVMIIESAEAGYSARYNVQAKPPQCDWNNCTRPIQEPFTLCDGRRSCSIPQDVLNYPQDDVVVLCAGQRDGNFIRISFTCVRPTGRLCFWHHVALREFNMNSVLQCTHFSYVMCI